MTVVCVRWPKSLHAPGPHTIISVALLNTSCWVCFQIATIGAAISIASSVFGSTPDWTSLTQERKMAAKQAAEKLISEHLVAVFSKSYCPYCSQAKSVIEKLGLDKSKVGILELDQMGSEGSDIQVCYQSP